MRRCDYSGKKCYTSPAAARRSVRGVGNKMRVYLCPACHFFHTTKQPAPEAKRP